MAKPSNDDRAAMKKFLPEIIKEIENGSSLWIETMNHQAVNNKQMHCPWFVEQRFLVLLKKMAKKYCDE